MKTDIFTIIIDSYLPQPHASLMNGILFGVDLERGTEFYKQVKETGLLHIVVLSGINITLLGSFVAVFTKKLGRKLSAVITIVMIVLFVWFVGADPPVTRAAIMGSLSLLAIIFERKGIALYMLFLSAVVVAVVKFEWLSTVSFQLSFGATLGIILWGNVPHKEPKTFFSKIKHFLHAELKPTFAAQVITTPIIFWYFRELSVIAPLSNLIVAFAIPPLMVFGLAAAFLGKIHMALGIIPAYISFAFLHYIIMSIHIMAQIPYMFLTFGNAG